MESRLIRLEQLLGHSDEIINTLHHGPAPAMTSGKGRSSDKPVPLLRKMKKLEKTVGYVIGLLHGNLTNLKNNCFRAEYDIAYVDLIIKGHEDDMEAAFRREVPPRPGTPLSLPPGLLPPSAFHVHPHEVVPPPRPGMPLSSPPGLPYPEIPTRLRRELARRCAAGQLTKSEQDVLDDTTPQRQRRLSDDGWKQILAMAQDRTLPSEDRSNAPSTSHGGRSALASIQE